EELRDHFNVEAKSKIQNRKSSPSSPFAFLLDHVRIWRQVVNCSGKMLNQVTNNLLYGEHSDQPVSLVHYRQMTVTTLFHLTDGGTDRILAMYYHGTGGHTFRHRHGQGLPNRQDAPHEVSFRENTHHPFTFTNQNAPYFCVAHLRDGIAHRRRG